MPQEGDPVLRAGPRVPLQPVHGQETDPKPADDSERENCYGGKESAGGNCQGVSVCKRHGYDAGGGKGGAGVTGCWGLV